MCEYVFKPQEALILHYSGKHNRVIEVVRVPGKWEQPTGPVDIRSDNIRKQPPVDEKCRTSTPRV